MMRRVLLLGAGIAAVGLARFCQLAIQAEHRRRDIDTAGHELKRWEGEGGHAMAAHSPSYAVANPVS